MAYMLVLAVAACKPSAEPDYLPNEQAMQKIWALQEVPTGTRVVVNGVPGPQYRKVHIVCNRRQDPNSHRMLVDIRENIAACNSDAAKNERTPWEWVIGSNNHEPKYLLIEGIALPCDNKWRTAVAYSHLSRHIPEWSSLLPTCSDS